MPKDLLQLIAVLGWLIVGIQLTAYWSLYRLIRRIRESRAWSDSVPINRNNWCIPEGLEHTSLLLVAGDSVAAGIGVPLEQTFFYLVSEDVGRLEPVSCTNTAYIGARVSALREQLNDFNGKPNYAIVSTGSNDLLMWRSPQSISRRLESFLASLGSAEMVIVVGPGNVAASPVIPRFLRPLLRHRMLQYESEILKVCSSHDNVLHVGPSHPALRLNSADFARDGLHPSAQGHMKIYSAISSEVGVFLEEPRRESRLGPFHV